MMFSDRKILLAMAAAAMMLVGCAHAREPALVDLQPARDGGRAVATTIAADFQALVDDTHAKYKDLRDGENASYIPILTEVPSDLFGVVIVARDGSVHAAGDVDFEFSIQSVAKPFAAALTLAEQDPEVVRDKIGVEATGMPFNSKVALAIYEDSRNPLVNAGAIAAVSLVEADSEVERWEKIRTNINNSTDDAIEPLGNSVGHAGTAAVLPLDLLLQVPNLLGQEAQMEHQPSNMRSSSPILAGSVTVG